MSTKTDYIYGFFYKEGDEKKYYYIGITKDVERRLREHTQNKDMFYKRGSKDGTVDAGGVKKGRYGKTAQLAEYVYYRETIVPNQFVEGFDVIETVVEGKLDITEDAVMARMIADGHPLQNSKRGERWTRWEMLANRKVRTVQEVRASDEKDAEEERQRQEQERLERESMLRVRAARLEREKQERLEKNRLNRERAAERKIQRERHERKIEEKRNKAAIFVRQLGEAFRCDTHPKIYEYRDRWFDEETFVLKVVNDLVVLERDEWGDFMFKRGYRVTKRREQLTEFGREFDYNIVDTFVSEVINRTEKLDEPESFSVDNIKIRFMKMDGVEVYKGQYDE